MVNVSADVDARFTQATMRQRRRTTEEQLDRSRSTPRRDPYLPNSIPPGALQQPAAPGLVKLSGSAFAVPAAAGTVLTGQVTVPPRMRRCVVSLTARVSAVNPGANDYLRVSADAADQTGVALTVPAPTNLPALNVGTVAALLEDLVPGNQFAVRVWAWATVAAWAADSRNTVTLDGSLGWSA